METGSPHDRCKVDSDEDTACAVSPSVGGSDFLQERLDLKSEVDLIAEHHRIVRAGYRTVEANGEVITIDLRSRAETHSGAALGIRYETVDLYVKRYGPRRAANREIAVDEVDAAFTSYCRRTKRQIWEVLDVKEIGGSDMVVTIRLVRVDRGGIDRDAHRRASQVCIGNDRSTKSIESATYFANHQMSHHEGDLGMDCIDFPRSRDESWNLGYSSVILGHMNLLLHVLTGSISVIATLCAALAE